MRLYNLILSNDCVSQPACKVPENLAGGSCERTQAAQAHYCPEAMPSHGSVPALAAFWLRISILCFPKQLQRGQYIRPVWKKWKTPHSRVSGQRSHPSCHERCSDGQRLALCPSLGAALADRSNSSLGCLQVMMASNNSCGVQSLASCTREDYAMVWVTPRASVDQAKVFTWDTAWLSNFLIILLPTFPVSESNPSVSHRTQISVLGSASRELDQRHKAPEGFPWSRTVTKSRFVPRSSDSPESVLAIIPQLLLLLKTLQRLWNEAEAHTPSHGVQAPGALTPTFLSSLVS